LLRESLLRTQQSLYNPFETVFELAEMLLD
jgi:hypothetical protein